MAAACAATAVAASAPSTTATVSRLLHRLTLAEKIALLHGAPEDSATDQGEAGYLPGVPRLGIPPLRFSDGPPGVLTRSPATALTATLGLAATFSRDDARANGAVIARDARALGIDVVLEPFINMHRDPVFSRSYNTLGEDPWLTGTLGAEVIRGIQAGGVMAQAKHFIAYEGANDVSVPEQALHEIYLAPFAAAIRAGVASIMCSYNLINGEHACGNRAMLTGLLRGELGFAGFVTSDWGAVHDTQFINAGLDLEMPGSGTVLTSYLEAEPPGPDAYRKPLTGPMMNLMPEEEPPRMPPPTATPARTAPQAGMAARGARAWQTAARLALPAPVGLGPAMRAGTVSAATIDRAAGRILGQMVRFGLLGRARSAEPGAGRQSIEALASTATIIRRTAEDAAVLLKNDAGALPLQARDLDSLAMIGPGALQSVASGLSGEKALGRIEREVAPASALGALSSKVILTAPADDMTGVAIPSAYLGGLVRQDARGKQVATDTQLDFSRLRGTALPPATHARWSGLLQVPSAGNYWLYLQVLGAAATLSVDGSVLARTGPLDLHGNVLQPAQDSLLPTRDGLDNVRKSLLLSAGRHAISVQVDGDESGQPVQLRLAWMTPEQRHADYEHAIEVARRAHTALVFAWSRGIPAFHLPGDQDRLIGDIADVNPNTIVILNISEPIAMPWLDRVKAVLLMWYPGDEGGFATADLLLGRTSPAGRLPFTWPVRLEDGVANDSMHPERSLAGVDGRTLYSEGIFIGYRWFDQQRITPLYPFGYGLSYTRFVYRDLTVIPARGGGLEVSFQVHNDGPVAGDEVPQVYLGPPSLAPPDAQFAPRALAQFTRLHLDAGRSARVRLRVPTRALQYWRSSERAWCVAEGRRSVYVAASSRDVRLHTEVSVGAPERSVHRPELR